MDEGYVLVIGSAGIDVKGRPYGEIARGISNLGQVRTTVGGVARNIAENLARLEVSTIFISAIGADTNGRRVLRKCEASGINCEQVCVAPGARTGAYTAILDPEGEPLIAISDFEVMDVIDSDYLLAREPLFAGAAMIVIDLSLTSEALATIFELAGRYGVRVCADPTAPVLAGKLCPYLDQVYMTCPNAAETTALCGLDDPASDYETAISAARHLVTLGAEVGVVTLGERGLAYADSSGGGYIRAISTRGVDPTGAGDAFSGAVIFGLLNDLPVDEAMRLGVTAASLTLQSHHTVVPNLTPQMLYDELAV